MFTKPLPGNSLKAPRFFLLFMCFILLLSVGYKGYRYINRPLHFLITSYKGNKYPEPLENWLRIYGVTYDIAFVEDNKEINICKYDALLVPGGGNVINAELYGCQNQPENNNYYTEYDLFELDLIHKFADAKKPILGVCRGLQILNVAYGGTLVQRIPSGHYGIRLLLTDPSSWLYESLGEAFYVWHSHYQCIDNLGEGLVADQWDFRSGIIEGFHHESLPVYGVQWHPESYGKTADVVMKAFKNVCYQYRFI